MAAGAGVYAGPFCLHVRWLYCFFLFFVLRYIRSRKKRVNLMLHQNDSYLLLLIQRCCDPIIVAEAVDICLIEIYAQACLSLPEVVFELRIQEIFNYVPVVDLCKGNGWYAAS